MKKVLGFDLDGVLYPWHMYVWKDYYDSGKIDFTYYYFWNKAWKTMPHEFWYHYERRKDLFDKEPYDGVVQLLHKYAKRYDIYYLTRRKPEMIQTTLDWVRNWGFPNPEKTYITQGDKSLFIQNYHTDYYVEDREDYLVDLYDMTQVIGVMQPWNEDYYISSANKHILWVENILQLPRVLEI